MNQEKQERLCQIESELEEINNMLQQIKSTTATLEYFRCQGILSEAACDDIYRKQIIPVLNRIYASQKSLTQACERITGSSVKESLQ